MNFLVTFDRYSHNPGNILKKKKVLISPLNWGLGHATRCIPIINIFLEKNWEVVIGAEDKGYTLLQREFPQVKIIHLPGIKVNYSKNLPFALKMLLQLPNILIGIFQEHLRLQKIIENYNIDLVVSDNRYGLWSKKVPSVFMTHQVHIIPPPSLKIFSSLILRTHLLFINRFHRLWIPDFEYAPTISGKLSHPPVNSTSDYIGPLSRFTQEHSELKYDFCAVISGPEPQRSIFEEKVMASLPGIGRKGVIIRGLPKDSETIAPSENVIIFNHLYAGEMQKYLAASKVVICRSGYSSIMDLIALKKPAVFVPTPGQTEQEYLAQHLQGPSFEIISQKNFSIPAALKLSDSLKPPDKYPSTSLNQRITESLNKLNDQLG